MAKPGKMYRVWRNSILAVIGLTGLLYCLNTIFGQYMPDHAEVAAAYAGKPTQPAHSEIPSACMNQRIEVVDATADKVVLECRTDETIEILEYTRSIDVWTHLHTLHRP
ncbi:MAG: hypothetical protein ABIA47_03900 [bacterium]